MKRTRVNVQSQAGADHRSLGMALEFMRLLWAVAHGLESASKRMHRRLGVTGPQRLVLRIIGHYGRVSAGELSQVLHVHPSSLTGVLRRLQNAGLVQRESDVRDRRRVVLELTRRGMRLNEQRSGTVEAIVSSVLAEQSKQRRAGAEALLKALAAALAT
ncbi:MAG: MarR family winged helix-turn-helix transcriptional regulator [Myxococcota bacterium]